MALAAVGQEMKRTELFILDEASYKILSSVAGYW